MGQMHGSNGFSCRRFFQERIDRFLMQAGFEKVLKFLGAAAAGIAAVLVLRKRRNR